MFRKGISFTLTIVIVAVVVLSTAFSLLVMQGNYLSKLGSWITGETESGFDDIEKQQVRRGCRSKMDSYCDMRATGGCGTDFDTSKLKDSQKWVCNAEYDGFKCYKAWIDSPESVPEC